MLTVLAHPTWRRLFLSQLAATVGTGLLTVGLGLLAFDLAGDRAGVVLGIALTIKMLANVGVAPIAQAVLRNYGIRRVLVLLDLSRAALALLLPFISEIWQIYVMIFLIQAVASAHIPAFQALIPDVLPRERDYTRALSLSRLATDMDMLISPILAALLLLLTGVEVIFLGTAFGFMASALLVSTTQLPLRKQAAQAHVLRRATRGLRLYMSRPQLRGMLGLHLTVAIVASMIFVNTVVIVQGQMGLGQRDTALALAAFGAGSMLAALILPRLLDLRGDRWVMILGGALLVSVSFIGRAEPSYGELLLRWGFAGLGYSLILTPTGRVLRRTATAEVLPDLFAAQFSLSHLCWLLAYPVSGWLLPRLGLQFTLVILGCVGLLGLCTALWLWRDE